MKKLIMVAFLGLFSATLAGAQVVIKTVPEPVQIVRVKTAHVHPRHGCRGIRPRLHIRHRHHRHGVAVIGIRKHSRF